MRFFAFFILSFFTVLAHAAAMGEADARHLLSRTGFGAKAEDIARFAQLNRRQAVERLLDRPGEGLYRTAPVIPYLSPKGLKALEGEEKAAFQRDRMAEGVAMRGWWLREMIEARSPQDALREHMTLFWHNHFVSSQRKVKSGKLMLDQNALLREHALGSFAQLLHAVSRDPAMIVYLDNASNRQGAPNENFAREVMELFTLGEGQYSEQDIKEAARAFTGWSFVPESGEYRWRPMIHDRGEKAVLGQRGYFDGDAVLEILLQQPSTAEFILRKLWLEFVSETPDMREIRRMAGAFRSSAYDIRTALRQILLSDAFWASGNREGLIKSPVDLVAGTLRSNALAVDDERLLIHALRQMGQDLFAPPNVRGWPGGAEWINAGTLLARKQFVEHLLRRSTVTDTVRADMQSARFQLK